MSKYVTFETEVEIDTALERIFSEMSDDQMQSLADDLARWGFAPEPKAASINVDDPAVLLDVIVELRKRGYTVEPGEAG